MLLQNWLLWKWKILLKYGVFILGSVQQFVSVWSKLGV